jgi:hypothetical protein
MMRVAFDIGGLISRYPDEMKTLMHALTAGGVEVHIMTDMNSKDAWNAVLENGLDFIPANRVHSCDWSQYGDLCKTKMMEKIGIHVLVDDRPDYCASGDFIGLVLSPRPEKGYYHKTWVNKSTPAVMVPPEEYNEFKAWKAQQKTPAD